MTEIDSNVYTGSPRPVFDEAWARVIERKSRGFCQHRMFSRSDCSIPAMTVKITNEEFEQLDEERSIKFADGSGYIAEPSVYHELHCIVSL